MTIDAVIAWVDGSDPVHKAQRRQYLSEARHRSAAEPERFADLGEVYFCIASILKFAPFVRQIHVLTDAQRPVYLDDFAASGLCAEDRIRVVDHRDVFAGLDAALPTFSSRSIEAVLHRIPGLPERFLYFNDDMVLTAPAAPADFFEGETPVLRGRMLRPAGRRPVARAKALVRSLARRPDDRPGHQVSQEVAAALMGWKRRFLRAPHCPHPMRVSTIETALTQHPGLLEQQIAHRFRDRAQYSPVALANHAELNLGTPWYDPRPMVYLRQVDAAAAGLARMRSGTVPTACLQDLGALPPRARAEILAVLVNLLGSHLPPSVRRVLGANT